MRDSLIASNGLREGDFKLRGTGVSRIEGFSDAAFAFAMTLLVVSLEVPRGFDQLLDVMKGIPAFAICFAILVWLWVAHYKFFRRFDLQDRVTIALNSLLLFVIMVYVYPLKFVFTIFVGMITGIQPSNTGNIQLAQVSTLFVIYGVGFFAVFAILALMNCRAYSLRQALDLDPMEQLMTRAEIIRCLSVGSVGLLSILIGYFVPVRFAGLQGLTYALIGLAEFLVGTYYGRSRSRYLAARATAS